MQTVRGGRLIRFAEDYTIIRRLPPGRPRLRGWSHLIAAFVAVAFTAILAERTAGDWPRLGSMLLYGAITILLFAGSAAYHMGHWTGRMRYFVRLLDHSNIFLKIAATVTAIAFNVLEGWERIAVLGLVWSFAGAGIAMITWTVRRPRWLRVGMYAGTGLAGGIALPSVLAALPLAAVGSIIAGGSLYLVGAVIYARKWPDPFPGWFEHHEVFHLFVIAGASAYAAAIWFWVVPFTRA